MRCTATARPESLQAMTVAAALAGHRDAAQRVAEVALDVARSPRNDRKRLR